MSNATTNSDSADVFSLRYLHVQGSFSYMEGGRAAVLVVVEEEAKIVKPE